MNTADSRLILKQALIKYREVDMQKALDGNIDYTFSPKFEQKMLRLCRSQRHRSWYWCNTVGKRAAITLAAILIVFSSMMCVQAVREPVIRFCTVVYDTFVDIFVENAHELPSPQEIETVYTISAPKNYTVIEEVTDVIFHSTVWQSPDGAQITLNQGILNAATSHDNEHSNYEILRGDQDIEIHYFNTLEYDVNTCHWVYQGYSFSLFTEGGQMTKDECLDMINSIIPA